ncbi:MAG: RsbRD N-terminal domain-containing protein [Acidobacteria bacterium]|nr:RsbRD N-terminal domain-containing protein [Acidobacteriota bacterium]
MIAQKLIHLIEAHATELAGRWLRDVQKNQETPTYHHFPEDNLHERAYDVYCQLGKWIETESHQRRIGEIYTKLGAERYREGFRLSEVVQALILTKRHLWMFVLEQGFFDSALELYQAQDLYNSVDLFFDRAIHFTVRGFETEARLYQGSRPSL